MNDLFPSAVRRRFAEQLGVLTTAQLRDAGLSPANVRRLQRHALVERVDRGVYVATGTDPTLEHRCRLLCAIHPEGFITGPTAAHLAGLRRQPPSTGLHLTVRHGHHQLRRAGVVYHQSTKIGPADRRRRPDGIVVASWPRLAFDLAGTLTAIDHRSALHQLLDRQLVTPPEIEAIGRRLCHPARRGSTTFARNLAELGTRFHDSHPEVVLAERLRRLDVPVEAQVPVRVGPGRVVHVDLGVPAARWGVELDIHPEHRTVGGHQSDAERARWFHRADWQVERVAELDLVDLAPLASNLAALYRNRVWALAPGRSTTLA